MNLCHLQSPVGSSHPPALSSSLVPLGSLALSLGTEVGAWRSPTRNQNYISKSRGLRYNFITLSMQETKAQKRKESLGSKSQGVLSKDQTKSRFLRVHMPLANLCPGRPKLLDEPSQCRFPPRQIQHTSNQLPCGGTHGEQAPRSRRADSRCKPHHGPSVTGGSFYTLPFFFFNKENKKLRKISKLKDASWSDFKPHALPLYTLTPRAPHAFRQGNAVRSKWTEAEDVQ